MTTPDREQGRGLIVLADGVQAAFAAGAVAELAAAGRTWRCGRGAGLGAQIAALALLGDAEEARARWQRQADLGCPLLVSQVAVARERLADYPGITALADGWGLDGWLDPATLDEHLAPDTAGLARRLAARGVTLEVAVDDLVSGSTGWYAASEPGALPSGSLLGAAARFPAGWGPLVTEAQGSEVRLWGGVGALPPDALIPAVPGREWDVICGFPVPPAKRPGLGVSLIELDQRRAESRSATAVDTAVQSAGALRIRVLAPGEATYRSFCNRDTTELGVEYPLPWERNGELAGLLLAYGRFVAHASMP